MIPVTADLTPAQRAAAFHGLATNGSLQPADRLQCALQALDLYEAEVESLRGQLAEGVAAGRTAAAAAVDALADELAERTARHVGEHDMCACGKPRLVLTGHEANEGIVAATRRAAKIAGGTDR